MCLQISYKPIISQLISVLWTQAFPKVRLTWLDWDQQNSMTKGATNKAWCHLNALQTDIIANIGTWHYLGWCISAAHANEVIRSCQSTSTQTVTCIKPSAGAQNERLWFWVCADVTHSAVSGFWAKRLDDSTRKEKAVFIDWILHTKHHKSQWNYWRAEGSVSAANSVSDVWVIVWFWSLGLAYE